MYGAYGIKILWSVNIKATLTQWMLEMTGAHTIYKDQECPRWGELGEDEPLTMFVNRHKRQKQMTKVTSQNNRLTAHDVVRERTTSTFKKVFVYIVLGDASLVIHQNAITIKNKNCVAFSYNTQLPIYIQHKICVCPSDHFFYCRWKPLFGRGAKKKRLESGQRERGKK